ncbi:MAG: hypothetical protein ACXWQO_18975, partial [Bdellovibrionota bacterium]
MGFISKEDALRRFLLTGKNSSHFVWFLSSLQFFECSNGWIFGFRAQGDVLLFAFEPLLKEPVSSYSPEEFKAAWTELKAAVKPGVAMFVGIYAQYMEALKSAGFQILHVGKEPYVQLDDCIPSGKSGRGVRTARN